MKILETLNYNNTILTVLVEEKEPNKAFATYFINGYEVKDWALIKLIYQDLLTTLLDEICRQTQLKKWSY